MTLEKKKEKIIYIYIYNLLKNYKWLKKKKKKKSLPE